MKISNHRNQKVLHEELQEQFKVLDGQEEFLTESAKSTKDKDLQLIRSTSSTLLGGGRVANFEPYKDNAI